MGKSFPIDNNRDEDQNPAIQLFGRRFYSDQTVPELLQEFLLVSVAKKRIGNYEFDDVLPELMEIVNWPLNSPLKYAPPSHLNLKLFSFLTASKISTRHETHRKQYQELLKQLSEKINADADADVADVIKTIENLFLGFLGVGNQRTWCAQSFMPYCRQMIAGETIWKEKAAAHEKKLQKWQDALKFFTFSQHIFLARGGELLYLQLCNLLQCSDEQVHQWVKNNGFCFYEDEVAPHNLHQRLVKSIKAILPEKENPIGQLAEFIDIGLEEETTRSTDYIKMGELRFVDCGWCPKESWPESLLFAIELSRLCEAQIDPMERIYLLEIACAMQVLRSLCAQSVRHVEWKQQRKSFGNPLGYVVAVSDSQQVGNSIQQISQRSLKAVQHLIYDAVHIIQTQYDNEDADKRYGHKLFLTLAKRIGFVIPRRGAGARFVLGERLLRLLVMTVIEPGQRVTYETFKKLVFLHYGMVFDDVGMNKACEWCGTPTRTTLGRETDAWLLHMLEASGVLKRLSDSCSLVINPSGTHKEKLS